MKHRFFVALMIISSCSLLVTPQSAFAQGALLETGSIAQIDKIQTSCDTIQTTLRRIHTNDALLRVNIGEVYNGISARLMARLNSRLALNRIDSTSFVDITNRYEVTRSQFKADFNDYDSALLSLMKIKCKTKPTEFYVQLLKTREARTKLSLTTQQLNGLVSEYRVAVEQLRETIETGRDDEK